MPKVSVIVPVYGVEKYIERCARSLFEQTLDDIEYLFIDDCTPDKSIEILKNVLEEYPHRKNQVIIHRMEKNSGQAAVRKWGMLNATGDYVIHCDSDDWVDVTMYEKMYNKAIEEGREIVACDYNVTDEVSNKKVIEYIPEKNSDFIRSVLTKKTHSSVCNKLVRHNLYKKPIVYPKDNNAEDYALLSQLAYYCKSVGKVNEPLYYYFFNPLSITKTSTKAHLLSRFKQSCANIKLVESFLAERGMYNNYLRELDYIKTNEKILLLPYVGDKVVLDVWRSHFKEVFPRMLFNPILSIRDKIRYITTKFGAYPIVKHFLK